MCNFSINFKESPQQLISKAEKAITGAGGKFSGDETNGNFSLSTAIGKIEGAYIMQPQKLNVHISHKPFFVSCKLIEDKMREYVS